MTAFAVDFLSKIAKRYGFEASNSSAISLTAQ
jgi:hypothetical protein